MIEPDDGITIPAPDPNKESPLTPTATTGWMVVGFLVVALAIGALLYRMIVQWGLQHTSLLFLGIPVVLGVILLLAPRPKSATGSILRGMALALLLVAPLVGEGYLCILFTAPLFLVVGLIIGAIADRTRRRRSTTVSCIVLAFLPLMLEGVVPRLTYDRTTTAESTLVVPASAEQVRAALSQSPNITAALPRFLRIGFPHPLEAHGAGLAPGDSRSIRFSGAEGDPPGDLVMRVAESRPGYVRFETVSDSSKLKQWVGWRSSEVTYAPIDATHTSVTWRITFDRQLDPYWYFTPWEKLVVHEAAGYLLRVNAVPQVHP
ncbi:MAG TPA: hypothetical protein VGN16_12260 [Acidobacteriaceae bacterium]|jgi:hypothetical protein